MWYIIIAAYVAIGLLAYLFIFDEWDKPTWEKVWYSVFWIALIPLWILHKIWNNIIKKDKDAEGRK